MKLIQVNLVTRFVLLISLNTSDKEGNTKHIHIEKIQYSIILAFDIKLAKINNDIQRTKNKKRYKGKTTNEREFINEK